MLITHYLSSHKQKLTWILINIEIMSQQPTPVSTLSYFHSCFFLVLLFMVLFVLGSFTSFTFPPEFIESPILESIFRFLSLAVCSFNTRPELQVWKFEIFHLMFLLFQARKIHFTRRRPRRNSHQEQKKLVTRYKSKHLEATKHQLSVTQNKANIKY